MRAFFVGALPLLIAVLPQRSAASPRNEARACIDAANRGQSQRDEGHLLAAREAFHACAEAACPAVIRNHCIQWLNDVVSRVPSIVVRAQSHDADVPGATLRLDGSPSRIVLDGRPLELDPGTHALSVDAPGFASVTRVVLVADGERSRPVVVALEPLVARTMTEKVEPRRGLRVPTASWVLAGVGALGFGTAGVTWYAANERYDALMSECGGSCPEARVREVATLTSATTVALGVGIAAVVGAVGVLLLVPSSPPGAATATSPRVGLAPGGLGGTF